MPGLNNTDSPVNEFMTQFQLLREVTAPDANVDAVPDSSIIPDLVHSVTASRNKLYLIFDGATSITVSLFVQLHNTSLGDRWIEVLTSQSLAPNALHRFEGLYAGRYKIVVTDITGLDGTVKIHESHSGAFQSVGRIAVLGRQYDNSGNY